MKLARGQFEICVGDDADREEVNAIINAVRMDFYNAGLIKAVEVDWDFAELQAPAAANAVDTVAVPKKLHEAMRDLAAAVHIMGEGLKVTPEMASLARHIVKELVR